jgi:hypothetical protein
VKEKKLSLEEATMGRFLRYVVPAAKRREVSFCGWSGTITNHTIKEYAQLYAIALGEVLPSTNNLTLPNGTVVHTSQGRG